MSVFVFGCRFFCVLVVIFLFVFLDISEHLLFPFGVISVNQALYFGDMSSPHVSLFQQFSVIEKVEARKCVNLVLVQSLFIFIRVADRKTWLLSLPVIFFYHELVVVLDARARW